MARSAILMNSLSIASRGGSRIGDLPKTCRLLPSTAILQPQNRYARSNRFIRTLPAGRVMSSLGPRAESRERRPTGAGGTLRSSAVCAMTGESTHCKG